jgi:outer membrane protein
MKNLFILCFLSINCTFSFSQKIAHINFDSLVADAPEAKTIKAMADKYMLELKTTMSDMEKELQVKYDSYLVEKDKMPDLKRKMVEDELQSTQKRIQDFSSNAEYDYQNKMSAWTRPLIERATKAIAQAAKEGGYKYVFDLQGNIIYSEPADDIFAAAKKKQDAMPGVNVESSKPQNTPNKGMGTQKTNPK